MNRISITLIVAIVFVGHMVLFADAQAPDDGYIDTHMHLMGFIGSKGQKGMRSSERPDRPGRQRQQSKDGIQENWESAADALVSLMDRLGVAKCLVMTPPQRPNQRGGYTYDKILPALRKHPNRLILVAGGGLLNPLIAGTDQKSVTQKIRQKFTEHAEKIVQAGAQAFGEMTALHYSFDESHNFTQVAADHPLFLLLADIAARYDMPIDMHMEVVLEEQPTPYYLRRMSPNNPEITPATIPGFERLLQHNRKASIVWQHMGWDNTGHKTMELVRRLLRTHPNLYCAVREDSGFENSLGFEHIDNRIHDNEYRPTPEWIALMREFPDRFMAGADEFIHAPGAPRRVGPPGGFGKTWSIIKKLPPDLREKVGRENALRVYGLH